MIGMTRVKIYQKKTWTAAFVALSHSAIGAANEPGDVAPLVISNGAGWEFVLEKEGFRHGFRQQDGTFAVPAHPVSGLLGGDPEKLSPAVSTEYLGEVNGLHAFTVTLADDRTINVRLEFEAYGARFEIENPDGKPIAMALRTSGAGPGYGLGDMVTAGWRGSKEDKPHHYQTEITGYESYDFRSTTGVAARMMSNFAIYPADRFAVVNIDPGAKIVVSKTDEILQGSRHTAKIDALYYFLGSPAEIYAGFLKARNRHGFPVMKPDYDMFGVGWEAWGALAWNTSYETVMADIDRYLVEGYPLKWAVIGSGFWPHEEERFKATTSFGMWDIEKYPDPEQLKQDFKDRGLRFIVGLRIAFIPGGPFTQEGLDKGYFLKENGEPRLHTVGFPKVPVYLLDVHIPEAVEWYVNLCDKWGVDGFKEDLYRYERYPLPDDKLDPVNIVLKKKGYDIILRNAYLSSAGSLHRIEDFNYDMNQDRGPVNTLALAYSGFPLTYMDIVGGLFGGREFDGEVSDRIKTYLMRNARTASLHSSISMGKGPWHYNDELVSQILLECAKLHARLHPTIHSNAIKFYQDGYPHTMTPLPIAFPDDPEVHGRENSTVRGFQWMIGDALMACPLYGEDYETATTRDIYLPQGVWIDYDDGTRHEGPVLLENFAMPVTKTPLFVGGTGIVVEEIEGQLMARIYPVANRAETTFISKDGETASKITLDSPDWDNPVITDLKTGEKIPSQIHRYAHQFALSEGHDYLIR
jgi:alpha-glucosidase (family GH31 glycosyl hydrolase)